MIINSNDDNTKSRGKNRTFLLELIRQFVVQTHR